MDKKLRYIILGLCFLFFITFAPWLLFYVQGVTFNTIHERIDHTGILAVETEPGGARVVLNGAGTDRTPAAMRFLPAGDYDISLEKEGYFSWQKRLSILENKVTWVNPNPDKLVLLASNQKPRAIANSVTTAASLDEETIYYASGHKLVFLSGVDFQQTQSYGFPEQLVSVTPFPNNTQFLVQGKTRSWYFERNRELLREVTTIIPPTANVLFVGDNALITLDGMTLSSVNTKQTVIRENVLAMGFIDGQLYSLEKNGATSTLFYYVWNETAQEKPFITLFENIPHFLSNQIFITKNKEIFLLGDGTLHRVNQELEPLAQQVSTIYFDQSATTLLLARPGELDYYNFDEKKIKLISRSSEIFISPRLKRNLNYAFVLHENSLKAIELDDRDHQNVYTLDTGTNLKNLQFLSDKKVMYEKDGTLNILTIR